ncbi:tyrosine-protein phosphatase [Peterkaempfera sp. SMS 1(5)a]|uniref:tyrosine-protein phosphatase n=1 Tax=Peterkaempfera podocarpi TaxID=3232308 RepID=UPI00366B43A5
MTAVENGPVAVAPRWVEFAEIDNVRDLGGLPVQGGGTTRRGVVFRASTPQQATADDVATLVDGLRLRTVIDLRGRRESALEGHGLLESAAVQRVNLPVRTPRPQTADAVPDSSGGDLLDFYRGLLAGSGETLVAAARIVGDSERHAVVFHCAVGKDRTGVLAALLLDAVGVPADAVAADYALTAQRVARIRARLAVLPSYQRLPSVGHGHMSADAEVMLRFLDTLHSDFGGGAEWLLRQGLTPAELDGLRAVLVVPAAG